MPIAQSEYRERHRRSDERLLEVLRELEVMEKTGTSGFIDIHAAEECVDRGWVETLPGKKLEYRLTDDGRVELTKHRMLK